MNDHASIDDVTKHAVDAVAVGTTVGTFFGWLPEIAALFTIIWTGIRIWETATVQGLMKRLKEDDDE